jgi:hypothetical protein
LYFRGRRWSRCVVIAAAVAVVVALPMSPAAVDEDAADEGAEEATLVSGSYAAADELAPAADI